METAFTELVGCRHPLQQAAMGGVAVPELAGGFRPLGPRVPQPFTRWA